MEYFEYKGFLLSAGVCLDNNGQICATIGIKYRATDGDFISPSECSPESIIAGEHFGRSWGTLETDHPEFDRIAEPGETIILSEIPKGESINIFVDDSPSRKIKYRAIYKEVPFPGQEIARTCTFQHWARHIQTYVNHLLEMIKSEIVCLELHREKKQSILHALAFSPSEGEMFLGLTEQD